MARNTDFGDEGCWQCPRGGRDDFLLQIERQCTGSIVVIVGNGICADCIREFVGYVQRITLIRECAVSGPVTRCRFICLAFGQSAVGGVYGEDAD